VGQGALDELMVQVKERAVEHKLDKLVQTVRHNLESKWKEELRPKRAYAKEPILPPFDDKLINGSLAKYIDYCCRFAWRIVTQVPPMKIAYQDHQFEHSYHIESASSAKTKTPTKIKCFLWPILLDFENRVITKGEVELWE